MVAYVKIDVQNKEGGKGVTGTGESGQRVVEG